MSAPRVRMFAGPNGSGKSTIKGMIEQMPDKAPKLGHYVNPDDIALGVERNGSFNFDSLNITPKPEKLRRFFQDSTFLQSQNLTHLVSDLIFENNTLKFPSLTSYVYIVSVMCDFIRHELLLSRQTFTFETVMSESGKVEFLRWAKIQGFRTYLYYVATSDPQINIGRIQSRIAKGGHSVPYAKVISRYYRSLNLLWPAMQATNRSFIFDNSFERAIWLAETDEDEIIIHSEKIFQWFDDYVLKKAIQSPDAAN